MQFKEQSDNVKVHAKASSLSALAQTTHFMNMIGYQQATRTLTHSAQAVSCTGILKKISMLMHLSQKN